MAGHKHPSYRSIYFLLLILFAISVAGPEVTDMLGLEHDSKVRLIIILATAFGVAIAKAYYVCSYFMHLKFEKVYAPYILLTCLALLFVFFFGTATDAMKPSGQNWSKSYIEEHEAGHHGEMAEAAGEAPAHEAAAHE